MTKPLLERLVGAAMDSMARRLTSSLRTGVPPHPQFPPSLVKWGQAYYRKPVDEEKAVYTVVNYFVRYTMVGLSSIALVLELKHVLYDREKQWKLESEKFWQSWDEEASKNAAIGARAMAMKDEKP